MNALVPTNPPAPVLSDTPRVSVPEIRYDTRPLLPPSSPVSAAEMVIFTLPEGGTVKVIAGQFALEKSVHVPETFHAPALICADFSGCIDAKNPSDRSTP